MKTKSDYTVLSKMSRGVIYSAQMLGSAVMDPSCMDDGECPIVTINKSTQTMRIIGKMVLHSDLLNFQEETGARVGSDEHCIDLPLEMLKKAGFTHEGF